MFNILFKSLSIFPLFYILKYGKSYAIAIFSNSGKDIPDYLLHPM